MCAALVSLAAGAQPAGAQAAQACPEPVFNDTYPYATSKQLVPMELTGVTPGTEYLLKVDGREVKQGIADSDKVSRKFRMPKLGAKREEARLVLVLANDGCENSPWKLKQKMELPARRCGDGAAEAGHDAVPGAADQYSEPRHPRRHRHRHRRRHRLPRRLQA